MVCPEKNFVIKNVSATERPSKTGQEAFIVLFDMEPIVEANKVWKNELRK
jgi:hypothetical protein